MGLNFAPTLLLFLIFSATPLHAKPDLNASVFAHVIQENSPSKSFEAVRSRLQQVEFLRVHFKQERKLAVLERPLVSSGKLLFDRSNGIVWETKVPLQEALVITPGKTFIASDLGERDLGSSSAMREISKIFISLFKGEFNSLQKYFEVSFLEKGQTWQIGFKPRYQEIEKMLTGIILEGGQEVNSVHVLEASGDSALISLSKYEPQDPGLSDQEKALFQQARK